MKPIELWRGDCLELMRNIPDDDYFNIAKQRIDMAVQITNT